VAERDNYTHNTFGTAPWKRSGWSGTQGRPIVNEPSNQTIHVPEHLKLKEVHPTSRNVTDFDTRNFDASDRNQVLALQKSLGLKQDGYFGPVTQQAYRDAVNKRRVSEGKDAYTYGNENAMQSTQPSSDIEKEYVPPAGSQYQTETTSINDPVTVNEFDVPDVSSTASDIDLLEAVLRGENIESRDERKNKRNSLWSMLSNLFGGGY
tara:strand:- start:156 stop:776 length:621 start_codon:yes stop_codon:yes gene_type:complete